MSVKSPATIQQLEEIARLSKKVGQEKFGSCYAEFTLTRGGELTERQAYYLILCLEGKWSGFKKGRPKTPIKETKEPYVTGSVGPEMDTALESIKEKIRKLKGV